MAVQVIGLDTAKHVFQVHGADASGRAVLRKRLRRAQIPDFFANLPKCVIGIEATQGAHYWSRVSVRPRGSTGGATVREAVFEGAEE